MQKASLFLVAFAVCTLWAEAQTPEAPTSTTEPDNTRYLPGMERINSLKHHVEALKGKPCDMIFIGDSITAGWMGRGKDIWAKYYANRNALDFGVGGDRTQNVLWRLENIDLKDFKPKVAVILIGTNNTQDTPQAIANGVKAVITKTQAMFAGVKVILVSIMPNRRANDKMMAADEIIKKFADDQSVYYLDLVPLMMPVATATADGKTDTNWKGLSEDHLHPDAAGYQLWADAMEPLVKKLLPGS